MAIWARVENDTVSVYPYGIPELKAEYANTSFPKDPLRNADIRASYGVVEVQDVAQPSFSSRTQRLAESAPVKSGDTWARNWVISDKSAAEVATDETTQWTVVRAQRNGLLSDSDWRDLPSYPAGDQAAWRTYRQSLRDVPSDNADPFDVSWPTAP
tara:strand:- start:39 stop:506 length:468 start_codon:yes stop_codon:yes gene_type:complete